MAHPLASGDPAASGAGVSTQEKGCHSSPHARDFPRTESSHGLEVEGWQVYSIKKPDLTSGSMPYAGDLPRDLTSWASVSSL